MAIDKINFSYPKGTLQSVFDNEALTALELASKTSKKVDECVEIVNGVEQTAIEATAIVDDMYVIQNQFITDNSDTRAQLINDNQDYINDLETSKTAFETDLTTSKELFEVNLNNDLTTFKNELNDSKATFEMDMSTAIDGIINSAEDTIEEDVNTKIDGLVLDGTIDSLINTQILGEVKDNIKDNNFNVKFNGAIGDGLTNDKAAIQSAIDNYDNIFIPRGVYVITEPLVVPSNKRIYGQQGTTIKTINKTEVFILQAGTENVIIENISMEGINDNLVPAAYGIGINENKNIIIKNCVFSGFTGGIIDNHFSHNIIIDNCDFKNLLYVPELLAGGYGVVLQGSENVKINNCTFEEDVERHSIYISINPVLKDKGCRYIFVTNNLFMQSNKASYITNFEYQLKIMSASDVLVNNNVFNEGAGHILISNATQTLFNKNIIINSNVFKNIVKATSYNKNISCDDGQITDNLTITNNIFDNNNVEANIKLFKGSNYIINNNMVKDNTGHFIEVEKGVDGLQIQNNRVDLIVGRILWSATNKDTTLLNDVIIQNNFFSVQQPSIMLSFNNIVDLNITNNVFKNGGNLQTIYIDTINMLSCEIKGNKITGGNNAIYLSVESDGIYYIYDNIFLNQTDLQITAPSALIVEPLNNGVSNTSLSRGNIKAFSENIITTRNFIRGDYIENSNKIEVGEVANKYIIKGWLCMQSPSTFVEDKIFTGN